MSPSIINTESEPGQFGHSEKPKEYIKFTDTPLAVTRVHDNGKELITDISPNNMSLSPISLLPVEILVYIFLLVARLPEPRNPSSSNPWWDWLILTKVCRHWRNTALEYPVLWTEIIRFRRLDKVQAFLTRSGHADLSVAFGKKEDDHIPLDLIEALRKEMSRVREFDIVTKSKDVVEWENVGMALVGSVALLRLKKLSLYISSSSWHYRILRMPVRESSVRLELLDNFTCASQLEELSLRGLSIRWFSPILRGLTKLSLSDINDIENCPTLSELLDILESCPNIHTLNLEHVGPKPEPSANIQQRSISLRDLEFIKVAGFDANVCTEFFSYLLFSEDRDIDWHVDCNNYPFDDPLSGPFIPNLLLHNVIAADLKIIFDDDNLIIMSDKMKRRRTGNRYSTSIKLKWGLPPNWHLDDDILLQSVNSVLLSAVTLLEHTFYDDACMAFHVEIENIDAISAILKTTWSSLFRSIGDRMVKLDIIFPPDRDEYFCNAPEEQFIPALIEPVPPQFDREIGRTSRRTYTLDKHVCSGLLDLRLSFADFTTERGRELYKMLVEYFKCHGQDFGREEEALSNLDFYSCEGITEKDINELKNLGFCRNISYYEDPKDEETELEEMDSDGTGTNAN